jgi:hypothetical protein
MRPRVPVLALIIGLALLGVAAPAQAQLTPSTFDQAAASFPYPVWKPARTLGMRASFSEDVCGYGNTPQLAKVIYRKPHSQRQLAIWEASPDMCGNPGEAEVVRRVRIRGVRANVWVNCFTPACHVKVSDGFRHGYLVTARLPARRSANTEKARRTVIQAMAGHMRLPAVLRMLRSLRPVRLGRPSVALLHFLSSDGTVWCVMREKMRQCMTDRPEYGGWVNRKGDVTLCGDAYLPLSCTTNWDTSAPRLKDGQRSDVGGYVCVDEAGAITCTVKTGAGAGRGFHVDVNGAEVVGPAP